MSEVHEAARRLESVFEGNPQVDWDNANREVIADLVTLARDWFERRDDTKRAVREILEEQRAAQFESLVSSFSIRSLDDLKPGTRIDHDAISEQMRKDRETSITSAAIQIPASTDIEA